MSLMEKPSSGLFLYFTQSRQSKKYTQLLTVYLTPQVTLRCLSELYDITLTEETSTALCVFNSKC